MGNINYNRIAWNEYTGLQTLSTAATYAGITTTNPITQLKAAFARQATIDTIADDLAQNLLTITDHDKWIDDAITKVQRAQAADALNKAFSQRWDSIRRRATLEEQARVIKQIAPTFEQHATNLKKAATQLPANEPLNLEAVIDHDATNAYKNATEALRSLALYASCFDALRTLHNIPSALNDVLPIIAITGTNPEIVDNLGATQNEPQLTVSRTVRKLAADLTNDIDQTLIEVARGTYNGVTLTTETNLTETALAAQRAFQRTKNPQASNVTIMR